MNVLTTFLLMIVVLANLLCFWAIIQTLRKTKDVRSKTGSILLLFVLMADIAFGIGGFYLW